MGAIRTGVVLDSRLRIPPSASILRLPDADKTIISDNAQGAAQQSTGIGKVGCRRVAFASRNDRVAWLPLLRKLAGLGVVSVLIEGGAEVAASALKNKVVDKLELFYAPKIVGGDGRAMIGPLGIGKMAQALALRRFDLRAPARIYGCQEIYEGGRNPCLPV